MHFHLLFTLITVMNTKYRCWYWPDSLRRGQMRETFYEKYVSYSFVWLNWGLPGVCHIVYSHLCFSVKYPKLSYFLGKQLKHLKMSWRRCIIDKQTDFSSSVKSTEDMSVYYWFHNWESTVLINSDFVKMLEDVGSKSYQFYSSGHFPQLS